jgi:hypothetical protein
MGRDTSIGNDSSMGRHSSIFYFSEWEMKVGEESGLSPQGAGGHFIKSLANIESAALVFTAARLPCGKVLR